MGVLMTYHETSIASCPIVCLIQSHSYFELAFFDLDDFLSIFLKVYLWYLYFRDMSILQQQ